MTDMHLSPLHRQALVLVADGLVSAQPSHRGDWYTDDETEIDYQVAQDLFAAGLVEFESVGDKDDESEDDPCYLALTDAGRTRLTSPAPELERE